MSFIKRVSLLFLGLIIVPSVSFAQSLDSTNSDHQNLGEEQALERAVLLILDGFLYEADKIVNDLLKMDAEIHITTTLKDSTLSIVVKIMNWRLTIF